MDEDVTRENLRSRSFRGPDPSGSVFYANDLHGADFGGVNLRGDDLSGARTGMRARWQLLAALIALATAIAIGAAAGFGGAWLDLLLQSPQPRLRWLGVFLSFELALFLLLFVWKGFAVAIGRVVPFAVLSALVAAVVAVLSGTGTEVGLAVIGFSALLAAVMAFAGVARGVAGAVGSAMFVFVAVTGALVGGATGGGPYAAAVAIAGVLASRRALRARAFEEGRGAPRTE